MADDAGMSFKPEVPPENSEVRFADMARQEFSLTARAFFAPLVGTVDVMRHLLREARVENGRPARAREKDAA